MKQFENILHPRYALVLLHFFTRSLLILCTQARVFLQPLSAHDQPARGAQGPEEQAGQHANSDRARRILLPALVSAAVQLLLFTIADFDALVTELRPVVAQNRRVRVNVDEPSGQLRPSKLTMENRILMTIKFLVFGSSLADLSNQFGLDDSAVNEELHHGVYAIAETLSFELTWPSAAQRQMLRDIMGPGFANAFGQVDGTFTPSFRQRGDYSGHRHTNLRAHQIATDSLGYIVHVVAGQIGSRHDAFNFQRSNLPDLLRASGANLLADIGYAGCEELGLVVPATASTMPNRAQRRAYNKRHKRWRSHVEQFIGVLKALFAVVARRWQRADRRFLSVCVLACCCLCNRWRRLRSRVHV